MALFFGVGVAVGAVSQDAASLGPAFEVIRKKLKGSVSGSVYYNQKMVGRINITPEGDSVRAVFYGDDKVEFEFRKDAVQVFLEQEDGKLKQLSPSQNILEAFRQLAEVFLFNTDQEARVHSQKYFSSDWKFSEKASVVDAKFQEIRFSPTASFKFLHADTFNAEDAQLLEISLQLGMQESFSVLLD